MVTHYEEASIAAAELAMSFKVIADAYIEGSDPIMLRQAIEQVEVACATFFGNALHLSLREPLVAALERIIPIVNLPTEYGSHVDLADRLVFALAGKLTLIQSVDAHRACRVG